MQQMGRNGARRSLYVRLLEGTAQPRAEMCDLERCQEVSTRELLSQYRSLLGVGLQSAEEGAGRQVGRMKMCMRSEP